MAYFSNGTEGFDWQDKYCSKCANGSDEGGGCPITDLHYEYNSSQGNKGKTQKVIKEILNTLIPMEGLFPGQCSMFLAKKDYNSEESRYLEELRFGKVM